MPKTKKRGPYKRHVRLVADNIIRPGPNTRDVVQRANGPHVKDVNNRSLMRTMARNILRLQITVNSNVHRFMLEGPLLCRVHHVEIHRMPPGRKQDTYLQKRWCYSQGQWYEEYDRSKGPRCPEGDWD